MFVLAVTLFPVLVKVSTEITPVITNLLFNCFATPGVDCFPSVHVLVLRLVFIVVFLHQATKELKDYLDCQVRRENLLIEVRGVCLVLQDSKERQVFPVGQDHRDQRGNLVSLAHLDPQVLNGYILYHKYYPLTTVFV